MREKGVYLKPLQTFHDWIIGNDSLNFSQNDCDQDDA
jgi:hypothetical protein